jgi:hypothetical protein
VAALFRPAFPFRSGADYLRALCATVRDAGRIEVYRTIPYCDNGADLVGLPEEVSRMACASCVLLAVHLAAYAYQRGRRVDLCGSVSDSNTEHAWCRIDGVLRDPSAEGGLKVPSKTYVGAVIVPVER